MKFISDIYASKIKTTHDQKNTNSSVSKMIESLTTVPPTKPNKKTASESAARKKKPSKKGESKVALSMTDLYKEKNPFKPTDAKTYVQDAKNDEDNGTSKISPDVPTPDLEKGNLDATLILDVPESGRKLGLEDLNDDIDSTENMEIDISNTGNKTKFDDSVEKDPEEVNSLNSIENSHSKENEESEEDPKENQEEDYSEDKEKDKNVVDVDDLESDEVPLINTLGEILAKRLRSNKWKVVTSVTITPKKTTYETPSVIETPKTRIKTVGV